MHIAEQQAGPLRRLIWWIWCLGARTLRPALFLALIAGALYFAWRGAVVYEAQTGWSPQSATLEQRIEIAFARTVPDGQTPERAWNAALRASLDPAVLPQPDLYLARSLAGALGSIAGRERLALSILGEDRDLAQIEADLRARPGWQRRRRLERVLDARLDAARAQGLEPAELVFAHEIVRQRFVRAERLYARTLSGVEAWFIDPQGRSLRLDALPGWAGRTGPAEVQSDGPALIAQACAFARDLRREPRACDTGFIVKPAADPVRLTLAALAVGLKGGAVEGEPGAVSGARLLLAAASAGILQPGMTAAIAGPSGADRPAGQLMEELMELLVIAGDVYVQPARHEVALGAAAARGLSGGRTDELAGLAAEVAQLRRHVGTGPALRLLEYVRSPDDLTALNAIAAIARADTLALFHLHGEEAGQLFALTQDAPDRAPGSARSWSVCAGLIGLALFLLVSARLGAMVEASRGTPSGLRRLALRMESLILGKNI